MTKGLKKSYRWHKDALKHDLQPPRLGLSAVKVKEFFKVTYSSIWNRSLNLFCSKAFKVSFTSSALQSNLFCSSAWIRYISRVPARMLFSPLRALGTTQGFGVAWAHFCHLLISLATCVPAEEINTCHSAHQEPRVSCTCHARLYVYLAIM